MSESDVIVIDKAFINKLFDASGMRINTFAATIGVSSKAVTKYRQGAYLPKQPHVVANIIRLAEELGVMEWFRMEALPQTETTTETPAETSAETPAEDTREFSPAVLKKLQETLGVSAIEMAAYAGVQTSMWYRWCQGLSYPTKKTVRTQLRKVIRDTSAGKRISPLTAEARERGSKAILAADTLHEFARTFKSTYQVKLDAALVEHTLTHATKSFDVDRRTLRSAMSAVLLVLKDRLTAQEIFELFSGHS